MAQGGDVRFLVKSGEELHPQPADELQRAHGEPLEGPHEERQFRFLLGQAFVLLLQPFGAPGQFRFVAHATPEYRAVETLLKGVKLPLPDGHFFLDQKNFPRHQIRTRWWKPARGETFRSIALQPGTDAYDIPELPADAHAAALPGYGADVRVAAAELCCQLIGTKHDIFHELFELDALLAAGTPHDQSESAIALIIRWLWGDICQMHELVTTLDAAAKKGPSPRQRLHPRRQIGREHLESPQPRHRSGRLADRKRCGRKYSTPMKSIRSLRHVESAGNAGLASSSPAEIPLTDAGKLAAKAAARDYEGPPPELIVVSPFRHAQETAAPFRRRFAIALVEEWPVQEFTYLSPKSVGTSTQKERLPLVEAY